MDMIHLCIIFCTITSLINFHIKICKHDMNCKREKIISNIFFWKTTSNVLQRYIPCRNFSGFKKGCKKCVYTYTSYVLCPWCAILFFTTSASLCLPLNEGNRNTFINLKSRVFSLCNLVYQTELWNDKHNQVKKMWYELLGRSCDKYG